MMSADAPPPQPASSSGLTEESTGQHLASAVNAQFKLHANIDEVTGSTPNQPVRSTLARRPEQYGVLKQRMMDACDSALDGAFVNMWILFSINHYDLRQERVLVLTEKSVLRIKLDFYNIKVQKVTRMLLSEIESVTFGPFQYEEGSMSAQVAEKGKSSLGGVDAAQGTEALKIQLKQEAPPSFVDKWNPFGSKIGETTTIVTSHLRAGESVRGGLRVKHASKKPADRQTALMPISTPVARRTRRSTTWSRSSTSSARSSARCRAASRRSARRSSPSARPSAWRWPWCTTRTPWASGARASS